MTTNESTRSRYFRTMIARCKSCKQGHKVRVEFESTVSVGHWGVRESRKPVSAGVELWNGRVLLKCACGASVELKGLQVGPNKDEKCGARCQGATGPACDCECGGENHGGKWAHI